MSSEMGKNKLKTKVYKNSISDFVEKEFNEDFDDKKREFFEDASELEYDRFLISAARGFGKTWALAKLALWSTTVIPDFFGKPYKVSILGGSHEQSKKVYEEITKSLDKSDYVSNKVERSIQSKTEFIDGSSIRALKASETSVRGQHSQLLCLDECAEIDEDIITSATESVDAYVVGNRRIPARYVLSSTPHVFGSFFVDHLRNPDKWGFRTYKWKAIDSWNKSEDEVEDAKRRLDKRKFRREWLGEAVSESNTLIDQEDLQHAVIRDKPSLDNEGYITGGVDWGRCFDEKTEVLTKEGWKHFWNLDYEDKIMTMDPENKSIEWQVPESIEYHDDRIEMDVVKIDDKTLSYCAKPSHLISSFDDNDNYRVEEYHDLPSSNSHRRIRRTGNWEGEDNCFWTKMRLKVLAWLLSEGTICNYSEKDEKYGRMDIYQSKKSKFREELLSLLERYSKEYNKTINEMERKIILYDKELWDEFNNNRLSFEKRVPKEVKNLPKEKLEIFLSELIKGDGNRTTHPQYYTSSEKLADDIQEISLKIGKYGYKKERERKNEISDGESKTHYEVNINESKRAFIGKNRFEEDTVYSKFGTVQVPNGMIYIRRKGQPYFTHNDHPSTLVVVQKQGDYDYVMDARKWRQKKFEWIKDKIVELYDRYEIDKLIADNSHQAVVERVRDAGAHIQEVSFSREKQNMISNMLFKFENGRVKIPHEFKDLREELRIYHRKRREKDDLVDGLMLALKGQKKRPRSTRRDTDENVIALGGKR